MKTLTETQLLKLAAKSTIQSKADAKEVLRENGHTIQPNLDGLMAAVSRLRQARFDKAQHKRAMINNYLQQANLTPFDMLRGLGRRIGGCDMAPKVDLAARGIANHLPFGHRLIGNNIAEKRKNLCRRLAERTFGNLGYNVGTHSQIEFQTTTAGETGCSVTQGVSYGRYSGRCQYKKREVSTTITIPLDWVSRVYFRNLDRVDCLMTLWAQPVDAVGCEAFAATWLEQGRGSTIKVVQGYIARANGVNYHASTLAKALAGLKRKANAKHVSLLSNEQLLEIAQRHSSAIVSVADARAIGACEPGIRSWIARTNIALREEATTLGELVAAYTIVPATEARAVIVRALRRCRALAA
jgi:hypothetical protein